MSRCCRLSIAAGLAAASMPVGVCLEGAAGANRKLPALGEALQVLPGPPPRPRLAP